MRRTTTSPSNPNRCSRNYSEFRVGQTGSESAFLASLNWYGIAAERDCRIVDWSSVGRSSCGAEFTVVGCVPLSQWHDHPFRNRVVGVEGENK